MFPRFGIPGGLTAVDETVDGVGRIVEADEADGKGTLAWTAGVMAEGALPSASDELSNLTYHSSKMLCPCSYWAVRLFELKI